MARSNFRKIYKRQGITHACAFGGLYAPAPGALTALEPGMTAEILPIGDDEKNPSEVSVTVNGMTERWFAASINAKRARRALNVDAVSDPGEPLDLSDDDVDAEDEAVAV